MIRMGHRMALSRGWLFGLMLALAPLSSIWATARAADMPGMPGAQAQKPSAELPDPAALPADWFGYFADAGGELGGESPASASSSWPWRSCWSAMPPPVR